MQAEVLAPGGVDLLARPLTLGAILTSQVGGCSGGFRLPQAPLSLKSDARRLPVAALLSASFFCVGPQIQTTPGIMLCYAILCYTMLCYALLVDPGPVRHAASAVVRPCLPCPVSL